MTRFSPLAAGITVFSLLGIGAVAYSVADAQPEACVPYAEAGKASSLVTAASAEEGIPTALTFPTPLITKATGPLRVQRLTFRLLPTWARVVNS